MNRLSKISGIYPSTLKIIVSVAQKASFENNSIDLGTSPARIKNEPFRLASTIRFTTHHEVVESNMILISH
jgi:hypothetical protein